MNKVYFVDKYIEYVFPYKSFKATENYGVLREYIRKKYSRKEIDDIVCEMIKRHPYVEGAMRLRLSVYWKDDKSVGTYHMLTFNNDNYKTQVPDETKEIKYEL